MKGKFEEIINSQQPVVVDFHATWCGPCKTQSPILKELASEYGDRIKVIKIDVDHNNKIASQYQIMSVPTIIIFQNGKAVWQHSGVVSKSQLSQVLQQYV